MALKKKKSVKEKNTKGSSDKSYFTFTSKNKKQILGLFLIIISLLLFFSIITFDRIDEANLTNLPADFVKSFDEKIDIQNWLGVTGAHFAKFFVKATFGYFSITIPIVLMLWGISFFKTIDFKFKLHFSNLLLISTIIFAAFFGVLRSNYDLFGSTYELSGFIGDHLGKFLSGLIGGIGSILLLGFSFITLLIFALDIDLKDILLLFKDIFSVGEDGEAQKLKENSDAKERENLDKIKKLSSDKKKKKEKSDKEELTAADLMKTESEEQTNIRIIRKDDVPVPEPGNEVVNDEIKKVDIVKTGELPEKKEKTETEKEMKLPDQWEEEIEYKLPGLDLLDTTSEEDYMVAEEELTRNAELLKDKLKLFDIEIKDISVTPGPVVTLYEIVPAPGVKISKIVGLENDIALALAARGIRIIAPIPGKSAIGVEIPNAKALLVNARSVIGRIGDSDAELPLALGKTISGDVYVADLAKMPHLLIAGSTGSGKSVGINMIISSLLYTKHPSEVKFAMVDPKKIELSFYNKLRKHYLAVTPDLDEEIITEPQNAVLMLKSVEYEMERRYDKLAKAGVRNIVDYNKKVKDPKTRPHDTDTIKHHPIPYIIVVVDELADLMITAGKEVEEPITRLAQLARAVGIHLVLATQRPSVNVITGVIKANFSSRIAYQVATKIDSRTILDMNGAEQLLGRGDMLFLPTGSPKPIRVQNAFISTDEVEKITSFVYSQQAYSKPYFLPSIYDKKKESSTGVSSDLDPMFEEAAKVIVRHQQGSVSLLQRRLRLGYSRAARIVDQLEEAGIVGPNDGSKARTVLVENEEQLETILRNL
ncbi:MAG TPA: DNA translocase FtsK 4TM domain-containing protein [Ignavibacteriaceae bacterium]|nr:MAG: DNA translocase SpoIIIE [Ignavibacteria bacterium ADurb.Bin266]HQF41605.1 DNA translocase FtsK 4TM domain-containing protein [Ignavibacteriaceae bacterium]HQI41090.1 DNA translocase FtsK 4TM domain-containing protein [Ignavibacteriaceae bacterium]